MHIHNDVIGYRGRKSSNTSITWDTNDIHLK